MMLRLILSVLAFAGLTAAAPVPRAPLVLAAASLQESMNAAADDWAARGHVRPVIAFAGSPALARQAEAGAPADLFVSADEDWMNYLAQRGLLVPGTRADLVANRLVLIVPASNPARIALGRGARLAAAVGSGRLAMADPDSVPAGRYGKAALVNIGAWNGVASSVVRAENVRAAMALVERGAAGFGVVYATDARASSRVRVAGMFPANSHPPIRYPVARLKTSTSPDAEPFRRFLLSRAGRAVFARFGFETL